MNYLTAIDSPVSSTYQFCDHPNYFGLPNATKRGLNFTNF